MFVGLAARGGSGWGVILMAMLPLAGPWGSRCSADEAPRLPNVVLILADDLGWTGLGCQGSDLYETPRIDGLARQGVRFTRAYAMSVCSQTRAMLMTGRHAARLGITIWSEGSLGGEPGRPLVQAKSRHDLPLEEVTLAERFREAGYLTAAVGKWHLGDASHFPETQGFDLNIGGNHWGAPMTYWWPYRGTGRYGGEYRYVPGLDIGRPGEYLTDRLTAEAIGVIDLAHRERRPFFLYLAHHAPHTPIEAKREDIAYFESKIGPGSRHRHPVFAAMMKSLDEGVGRVLDRLADLGIDDETIVIFTSDNGGHVGVDGKSGHDIPVTSNHPLRSGKGSLYEGGIRVPLIVRWPGKRAVGKECDEPIWAADFFPTLTGLLPGGESAGGEAAAKVPSDGVDFSPLLDDPAARLGRDTMHFHYPHYYPTTTPAGAILEGDWKLIEYFEDGRVELYHLAEDVGEATELSARHPERAAALRAALARWREEVQAQMPTPATNSPAGATPLPTR